MKKIFTSLMVLAVLMTSIAFVPGKVEAKTFSKTVTPKLNSIKVSWKKQKGAKKYRIYRLTVDINKYYNESYSPKKSDYKKIKTVKKNKFFDKKAKFKKFYSYIVDAVSKKGKVISSSWDESIDIVARGLDQPSVSNHGYGEDYCNSPYKLYLYMSPGYYGYVPKKLKYKLYRKEINEKKYVKIKTGKFVRQLSAEYCDTKVKPGKKYLYKVKAFYKKGKKTYTSVFSDALEMETVAFKGQYKAESITPSGTYNVKSMDAIIKFSNGQKYNGVTYISGSAGYSSVGKDGTHQYKITVKEFSSDNVTWKSASKVEIPQNGSVYVKFEITTIDSKDDKIYYAGSDRDNYFASSIDSSYEDNYFIDYHGSGYGDTYGGFDLLKKTGYAYQDWD